MPDQDNHVDFVTIHSRHDTTPTAEHIHGPYRAKPEDTLDEYLVLRLEGEEYYLPVTNLMKPLTLPLPDDPDPSEYELWDVDRVLWDDDTLVLEVHQDDAVQILHEDGMMKDEKLGWERLQYKEPIADPDKILWERDD